MNEPASGRIPHPETGRTGGGRFGLHLRNEDSRDEYLSAPRPTTDTVPRHRSIMIGPSWRHFTGRLDAAPTPSCPRPFRVRNPTRSRLVYSPARPLGWP